MQVCIADLKGKDQKDGAHDNLIMTFRSKFGMPACFSSCWSKFCVPTAGTAILMFTPSLNSDSAHWLINDCTSLNSGKQFKIASYIQAKEYLIEYTGADPGGWIGWLATPLL